LPEDAMDELAAEDMGLVDEIPGLDESATLDDDETVTGGFDDFLSPPHDESTDRDKAITSQTRDVFMIFLDDYLRYVDLYYI
jgi:hypothetical protein